jgi:hypothetical protein
MRCKEVKPNTIKRRIRQIQQNYIVRPSIVKIKGEMAKMRQTSLHNSK